MKGQSDDFACPYFLISLRNRHLSFVWFLEEVEGALMSFLCANNLTCVYFFRLIFLRFFSMILSGYRNFIVRLLILNLLVVRWFFYVLSWVYCYWCERDSNQLVMQINATQPFLVGQNDVTMMFLFHHLLPKNWVGVCFVFHCASSVLDQINA